METDKVISTLNGDPGVLKLLQQLNQKAQECGIEPGSEQYLMAREMILLAAMYQNKEIMSSMAEELYHKFREGAE